jgi:hypothetical protein
MKNKGFSHTFHFTHSKFKTNHLTHVLVFRRQRQQNFQARILLLQIVVARQHRSVGKAKTINSQRCIANN